MKEHRMKPAARKSKPGGGKPGRRERRSAETREKIFRAALRLFARRGYQATTVKDITEAADVGKGTFFNYFPTKEHVLAAFSELQRSKMGSSIADARKNEQPVWTALSDLLHRVSEEPAKSPPLMRSLLIPFLTSEPVRGMLLRNLELSREKLAELLAIGQQRGEIRNDRAAIDLAAVVQRAFFGTTLLWSLRPDSPLSELLDAELDLVRSGIKAQSAGPEADQRH